MVVLRVRIVAALFLTLVSVPLLGRSPKVRHHAGGVPSEYVVLLDNRVPTAGVTGIVTALEQEYGVVAKLIWPNTVKGFLASGPQGNLEAMADDPRVLGIEQNVIAQMPATISGVQGVVYWGQYLWYLDRLDALRWQDRDGAYNLCPEGRSVYAYVIDEGIWQDHPEFESPSRVVLNVDFSSDRENDPNHPSWSYDKTNGCLNPSPVHGAIHGTAAASALAGTHVGSSKAKIISLKVIDCGNSVNTGDFFSAIDWIYSADNPYRNEPAVVNHSGFVPVWDSNFVFYETVVNRLVTTTQMPFFASANNYSCDACQFSPQGVAYTNVNHGGTVFVVGGTTVVGNDDYRYQLADRINPSLPAIGPDSGSNSGACVSAYAPAQDIYVAINDRYFNDTYYAVMTGTSFSAPLTAGIAARYIEQQRAQTGVTPGYRQVYDFLLGQAVTPVLNTETASTYWLCVSPLSGLPTPYRSRPASCPFGTAPIQMNSASNTSNARMVFWNPGCP